MGKRGSVKSLLFRAFLSALLFTFGMLSAAEGATVKAISFAIYESNTSSDDEKIMPYMKLNSIDFGIFDYTKASNYFSIPNGYENFKKKTYTKGTSNTKVVVWDSNKYELVDVPENTKNDSIAAVFRDFNGDEFALISFRYLKNNYDTDVYKATYVVPYLKEIAGKYPTCRLIVTYNARVKEENAETLDSILTTDTSGPLMKCLGRSSKVGAYMYEKDIPSSYSFDVVESIGTTYPGVQVTLECPIKYKVIFNDWDGTGLQTNIVYAGESVTPPPAPQREGYTFTGWDHDASEFVSVSESFTATAQYAENVAWLNVSGDPENFGAANPAYGAIIAIAANDTFTASVAAPAVEEDATERWVCTGYTHYEITDLATGEKTVAQEGNTASFTYTHVMNDELVWHFTNEWLVSASASQGGSVSISESWVRNGDSLRLVATPEEGYALWRWDGDTDGIADVTSASIEVSVTSARSLRAVFAPPGVDASVQYVATTGDDANDGYSAVSPKLTIQAAVDTLAAKPGYGIVYVDKGVYILQEGIVITNAIALLGATGNPEDVILRAKEYEYGKNLLSIRLNNADAFVANLVVENGFRYQASALPFGSNIAIEGKGGTVSNCVIRGGSWYGMYARGVGAWLNSDAALLTHCVVTNNNTSGSSKQIYSGGNIYGGLFVHIEKGVVANCLIANNRDTGGTNAVTNERQSWACGVTVMNGCILNCTVVTNEARYTGGVYLYSTGYATNVVVAGCVNRCTYYEGEKPKFTDIGFKGTLANAYYCASDGGEAHNSTCVAGTPEMFFRDFAARDYRPVEGSQLVNKGVAYGGITPLDLAHKPRVQGRAPDIGCYEFATRRFIVIVR